MIARYASGQYNVDGGVMEIVAYSQSNGSVSYTHLDVYKRQACALLTIWRKTSPTRCSTA